MKSFDGKKAEALLASLGEEITVKRAYPLSQCSTFRIGGEAALAVWPRTEGALCRLLSLCRENGWYHTVIGNGSNVLFDDAGFDGAVLFTSALADITFDGTAVTASCGVPVTRLAAVAAEKGLAGLSFAYGIPGTVGGAVYMNAGAYGGEIGNAVESVFYYDGRTGETGSYTAGECRFGYRGSAFQEEDKTVLAATLRLKEGDPAAIREEMEDCMRSRKEKQPLEYPSAGSVFRRCPGYYTGKLIEDAGLKGTAVGGAQVSLKHAGFIVNRGNATAADVRELISTVRETVKSRYGLTLECEVRYIPATPAKKEL